MFISITPVFKDFSNLGRTGTTKVRAEIFFFFFWKGSGSRLIGKNVWCDNKIGIFFKMNIGIWCFI